ncbi:MAG: amino acid ABC transporter substrate-binding protein [Acidimicrobiales bacterium]
MRHRRRTGAWILLIVLPLLLGTAACGDTEDPTAGDDEEADAGGQAGEGCPVTIGISLPLTGDFSEPGKGVQQGYELWAEGVNEEGGLLGCEVELIFRDDGSDNNTVVSDYEHLITVEEVDLVFGPFSSRLVIAASEVAEEHQMLFVEPAGAAADVFDRGLEYLFYAAPAVADDHYNFLAEWILALPDDERPQTFAVASLDDPFAQGTAYGLRDKLVDGGLELVLDQVYPPETTDFLSIAARIADADAELFVGGTQFEDSVGLVRAFQELGYQPAIAAFSTGPTLPEFPEAIGGAADGILSPVGWSDAADHSTNLEFVEAFRETFGEEANEDSANGYTVGQIVAQAVEAVGCADPSPECQTQLRDYIRENEFDTIVGPLSYDEAGRPQGAHMIQQWIGGEIEIVLPEETPAQTAELVFPKPEW